MARESFAVRFVRFLRTGSGQWRWSIKTMSDVNAQNVALNPVTATIDALIAVPKPRVLRGTTPRQPSEMQAQEITARVTMYKVEQDGDWHVVLADPQSSKTMICELPSPTDSFVRKSKVAQQIGAARTAFSAVFPAVTSLPVGQKVMINDAAQYQIVGIQFFDELHGQDGVAPNGVELHPVLQFARK